MSHLNSKQIDSLLEAAGVDNTRAILEAFWQSTETLLSDLQAQLGGGDVDGASQTAHALKGSAANVGAKTVEEHARSIEQACRNGEDVDDHVLDMLSADFLEAREVFEDYVARFAAGN